MKVYCVIGVTGILLAFAGCGQGEGDEVKAADRTVAAEPDAGGAKAAAAAAAAGEAECTGDCEGEAAPMKAGAIAETGAPAAADGTLGTGITLSDVTEISAILAAPEEFEGKRVLVAGEAVGVCKMRGCWVELKSDKEFESIRVKVEDGEIVFPATCLGSKITAEGLVEKVVVAEEARRAAAKKKAEAAGEEFDPASVTGDLVIWRIRGLGARIEG